MDSNVRGAVRAGEYEQTEEGIYLPTEKVMVGGYFSVAKRGEEAEISRNLVVNEGLTYVLRAAVGETAGISSWYVALFSGDVTVLATWTAAGFDGTATEWTSYDEAARPAWTKSAVASQGTDSFSNKASFTSSADAQTVTGAALLSASAKGATSGILLAASRLSSDKTLATGEILDVGYGLTLNAS
jgi:hypothetical protein